MEASALTHASRRGLLARRSPLLKLQGDDRLIAMARAVNVPLTIDDFQKTSNRVPYIGDLRPSGKWVEEDLHNVGGTPAVMKYLLEKDLLDGSCRTVTGKTVAENLKDVAGLAAVAAA